MARILSVVVWVPGEKEPRRFKAGDILAAGLQGPTTVCAYRDAEGHIVELLGHPMEIVKDQPSGLVAPRSGGVILPPT